MEFILIINVKMPTIVGILTFISRISTKDQSFKAREIIIFQHFSFLSGVVSSCSVELSIKKFINSGPELHLP